ncbi:MAG: hypothetical protein JW749_04010 [Sedimentisphaerales bacterium]|nr:hypothetical protein [Sedimentisphaerales bacterium]
MKKLLFVLLLLGLTVPVSADVLVYTMSNKGISFMEDSPDWEMEKENIKGYIILEGGPGDDTVDMWVIATYKEKDKNGKMQKYVSAESLGELGIITADAGKKTIWIITSGDNEDQRILLKGYVRNSKIGTIATKLVGNVIWDTEDNPGERDIGSSKVTLSLHTKYTLYAEEEGYDGITATMELMNYLVNELGYIPD